MAKPQLARLAGLEPEGADLAAELEPERSAGIGTSDAAGAFRAPETGRTSNVLDVLNHETSAVPVGRPRAARPGLVSLGT